MTESLIEKTKELISDPKLRIHLHDLVADEIRETQSLISAEHFPPEGTWNQEEFVSRLDKYETAIENLTAMSVVLGYWGTDEHRDIMTLPIRRLSDPIQPIGGSTALLALRWYPIHLLTYSMGIASVAGLNYSNLSTLLHVPRSAPSGFGEELPMIMAVTSELGKLNNTFNLLPGREKQRVPRSEYLYDTLQPIMDKLLFLGDEYDKKFDLFELLLTLEHAHLGKKSGLSSWGPIGRFGWKHRDPYASPFVRIVKEAEEAGDGWKPLSGGLFDGSIDIFMEISKEFAERLGRF